MKHKIFYIIFFSFFVLVSNSQNLVRNGSFEKLNTDCVLEHKALYRKELQYWYQQFWSLSPEVFNPCDTTMPTVGIFHSYYDVGVPKNDWGYQHPSTKNNYVGIVCALNNYYNPFFFQEIISTELKQRLDSNVSYSFSMKVSVSNNSNLFFDGLGACLSSDSLIVQPNFQTKYISSTLADITQKGNGFLTDTANWIKIAGTFTAIGNEKYLHIADLDSIKNVNDYFYYGIKPITGTNSPMPISYYYIDDVALWRADDSTYISSDIGQEDTTICYGDSLLLGSNHYPETYYGWQSITHTGQNIIRHAVFNHQLAWVETHNLPNYFKREQIYDSAFVWVKPTKTTSYILETTNCIFEKTYDTVLVIVQKCGPNAGMDTAVCKNSTLVLGGIDNIGYNCQWYPNTFLSSDTAAMPTMTATQSMMYYLSISDAWGVIKTDSIYVIAGDCYYSVEVRDDTLICKGDTVHLGKHTYAGAQYEWSPNWLLNNNTIANPYCLADSTILYTLKLTDVVGNVSYDSVLVGVTICPGLLPSTPLSQRVKVYPNPAKEQITFELLDYSNRNNELSIYNSTGMIVYNGRFDGTIKKLNTSKFKSGIYFYRIIDSKRQNAVGKFVVW